MCKGCREGHLVVECRCACGARERVTTFVERGELHKKRVFSPPAYLVTCRACEHKVISALPDPLRARQRRQGIIVAGIGALGMLVSLFFLFVTGLQGSGLDRLLFIFMIIASVGALTAGLDGAVFVLSRATPDENAIQRG